ncbi:MAG TPA: large-conductance mechanosensitive channel protein MscL [Anaerohalosphaeraceae bacterium]|jgi:large conductance mechanosensitive channel|nr:large-conductance mechanosensitive channel protein MscL [Anaerohalosphaeraceae bacterium]HPB92651.1 large-conductance mechanosensitive channel protein MscL [Anaerohalosphaeraceae bacterium]HRT23066.1 large-conductance mechanosensitive channel protein MscL [Anaerohalosphaeraceae bacterium]HRU14752.1 large-conductance mechanosensitive channel protein MscL [Anaerohalosphaeraceae bacterium]
MSLWSEFKAFAMRGNVIDMAVGIIIGGAFGKIVNSLVNDVMMPPLGMLLGQMDFSQFSITLKDRVVSETGQVVSEAVKINYGMFLNTLINFFIVAIAVFALIKAVNMAKRKEEAAPAPGPSRQEILLEEIRDLLARK